MSSRDVVSHDSGSPPPPRRFVLEILLDPRSIQWLLVFGAIMLVVGLVIYLYVLGVFANAVVVAALMGTGTVGLLGSGGAAIRFTRYRTAGQALALLACLVMPLNLWFYHAQGLEPFTLYDRLWIPALVCCGLYVAAAWLLRQPLFVYVLVGGVTLTGLLILANIDGPTKFIWQITHAATLLVVLGLLTLHAERAFPEQELGEFTRRRFGRAFFQSGHVVLGLGLLLVLLAQLYGLLYFALEKEPVAGLSLVPPAPLTTDSQLKALALLLVLAGTYTYVYSDLVVHRGGAWSYLGTALLVAGHIGWYREQRQSDLVGFSLFLGSVLVALPLAIAVMTWRYFGIFHGPDEIALLAAGTVLFLAGVACRVKSTTLAGAAALVMWLVTLLIYLPWSQWDLPAIALMVGGGAIFLIGLLLSVFRDRLLALREKIRRREGLFRVLTWR
jgi:hypothetical protein